MTDSQLIQIAATTLLGVAVLHTFCVPVFARLAHRNGPHSGFWHALSEVEAVFGVWSFVLLIFISVVSSVSAATAYMDSRNFTEPLFVFAIMVVAASRPITELMGLLVRAIARLLPVRRPLAIYFVVLAVVPLAGSLVTEPAAMTLAALLLRDGYFRRPGHMRFKYMTLAVLLVNVSIGGVLSAYAAPPVLLVAHTFGWDSLFMLTHFGWRAACAVVINALLLTVYYRKELLESDVQTHQGVTRRSSNAVPTPTIAIHVFFLVGIVVFSHHPSIFLGLLMLFIGFTEAYPKHQSRLMIKEGLLVGFFLAGLVILGGLQKWWLQDLLGGMEPLPLFWVAVGLTAVTDNAALTYLGSLVDGTSDAWRYMLVAGAVTGGGLTVIANAPNPAGFAILKGGFPDETIPAIPVLLAALLPTLIAAAFFLIPVQ